jgi:hypothetical protein
VLGPVVVDQPIDETFGLLVVEHTGARLLPGRLDDPFDDLGDPPVPVRTPIRRPSS